MDRTWFSSDHVSWWVPTSDWELSLSLAARRGLRLPPRGRVGASEAAHLARILDAASRAEASGDPTGVAFDTLEPQLAESSRRFLGALAVFAKAGPFEIHEGHPASRAAATK